jgi:hypothetical protein
MLKANCAPNHHIYDFWAGGGNRRASSRPAFTSLKIPVVVRTVTHEFVHALLLLMQNLLHFPSFLAALAGESPDDDRSAHKPTLKTTFVGIERTVSVAAEPRLLEI